MGNGKGTAIPVWGLFGLLWFTGRALAAPCLLPTTDCRELVPIDGNSVLPVYRTQSLTGVHPEIRRAVLVVHGVLRNADEYFADVAKAAVLAGEADTTLVLAPHFQAQADLPPAGELYWDRDLWKRGEASLNGSGLSSFAAVDRLVKQLSDPAHFPAMGEIVVTGHSAGGQLISRYAAASRVEDDLGSIGLHYVVANPSTYFYPNAYRARPGSVDRFELPDSTACPDYNEYPYGTSKANAYVQAVSTAQMEKSLASRHITLLLGKLDTEVEYLDMSCGANLQGPYRFLRGLTYANFLEAFLKPKRLSVAVVPGVGHSGQAMYQSLEGQAALFH